LSENVHRTHRSGNNALYEALGVVQDENSVYFGWWPHREEEYKVWRQTNNEEELRRLRAEERRREGNNSNRNRMS
ncbi:16807_t:CDS:2, partial [Racocetra persica]